MRLRDAPLSLRANKPDDCPRRDEAGQNQSRICRVTQRSQIDRGAPERERRISNRAYIVAANRKVLKGIARRGPADVEPCQRTKNGYPATDQGDAASYEPLKRRQQ